MTRHGPKRLAGYALAVLLVAVPSVLAGYGVVVLTLGRVPDGDDEWGVVFAGAAGLLVGLVVARWLGLRIAGAIRPRVGGSPDAVLATLGARASRGVPTEELLLQLAESLRRVVGLSSVEVWTGDGARLDRLLSVPTESVPTVTLHGPAVARLARVTVAGEGWLRLWLPELLDGRGGRAVRLVPALHGGEVLGLVVVTRDADRPRFHDADERTLLEVGRRLGIVLHNRALDSALQATLDDLRRTNDDLRASRGRLAAASDDVRRRIERDLHDGAQQHLVAIAVNLGLAGGLVDDDPAAAKELVEQTRLEARAAVGNLRDLAHGIYPAQLIQSGLGHALRSLGTRTSVSPEVTTQDLERLDPTIEAAVYFCCLEAIQNAAKHAPDSPVAIVAVGTPDELRVEVVDHGPGMPAASGAPRGGEGQGVQNMVDRIGAVGGTVGWSEPDGGGTRVLIVVPLDPDRG